MSSTSLLRIVSALALAAPILAAAQDFPAASANSKQRPAEAVQYGKLPLSFEPNLGQTAKDVQWLARGPE
jgi:hypothetical protein